MDDTILVSNAASQQRETFKNKGVEAREAGDLKQAEKIFNQVIEWDKKNNNLRGQIDVMGHLRIVYTRLVEQTENKEQKKIYLQKASQINKQVLQIAERNKDVITEGSMSILKVHIASTIVSFFEYFTSEEAKAQLEKALNLVNEAIETLPGSKAHKAWPLRLKGEILHNLGKTEEAIEALTEGEVYLYLGYKDEIGKDDQAEIKINVWLSGLHLTFARICAQTKRDILAKHYVNSVLSVPDPKNILRERKKEAERILVTLK